MMIYMKNLYENLNDHLYEKSIWTFEWNSYEYLEELDKHFYDYSSEYSYEHSYEHFYKYAYEDLHKYSNET